MRNYRRERRRRGFTLLSAAVCGAALFGAAGLAFDIGRIYITKSESQGYADAAAVAGAMKLNGTSGGLTASDNAVAASINRWSFSTTDFSGTVVDYSADGTSGWATSGSAVAANMRYVRVTSTVSNLPLYFLPVLGALTSSIGVSTTVNARAVAGLVNEPPVLLPFSPIAHDVTINVAGVAGHSDANYGFTVGVQYDLMWPGKPALDGIKGDMPCSGDNNLLAINQVTGQTSRMGQVAFNGASAYAYQITDDVRPMSFTIGQSVEPGTGQKNAQLTRALNDRVAQDSDKTSATYAAYTGNGRRLVVVVVQSGFNLAVTGLALLNSQQNVALGYAQFLLLPQVNGQDPYDQNPSSPFCAIYVGNSPEFGTSHTGFGGNGAGEAFVRLTQ